HRQIACVLPSFIQSASARILAARGESFSLIKVFGRDPRGALVPAFRQPIALTALQELGQGKLPCLTGFFPGSELNPRLFHGKARHGPEFPTVPVWCREAMRHFDLPRRSVVRRSPRRRV